MQAEIQSVKRQVEQGIYNIANSTRLNLGYSQNDNILMIQEWVWDKLSNKQLQLCILIFDVSFLGDDFTNFVVNDIQVLGKGEFHKAGQSINI